MTRVAIDILRSHFGDVHYFEANTVEQLREGMANRAGRPCMVYFNTPEDRLSSAILKSGVPVVLVEEDFEQGVYYSIQARGMSVKEAIRFTSQCATALHPIAAASTISPMQLHGRNGTLEGLINRIMLSLGIALPSESTAHILDTYGQDGNMALHDMAFSHVEYAKESLQLRKVVPADDRRLIAELSPSYTEILVGGVPKRFRWPVGLCLSGEKPHGAINAPIDLTGPARALSFGPYLHLPKGVWVVEVTFTIQGNVSGNEFLMDVMANGGVTARGNAEMPEKGTFTTKLEFSVEKSEMAIEVRTFIMRGAIEGQFELIDITLSCQSNLVFAE